MALSAPLRPGRAKKCLALLVLLLLIGIDVAAGEDPLKEIAVSAPPDFRKRLADDMYKERQQKVLAALGDVEALAKSAMPAVGAAVVGVEPLSQAASLGIKPGDIVFRVDDKPVLWRDIPRDQDAAATWQYYAAATGGVKSAEVQAGRFGIAVVAHWRPELLYLRGTNRNPKWERHVLAGIAQRSQDTELAETAWHHALAGGYAADALSAQCGAEIAMQQGRPLEAWKFAVVANRAGKVESEIVSPLVVYNAAISNYQLATAQELARRFPQTIGASPESLRRLIELHSARPEAQRALPPPSEMAKTMYRDNLLPRLAVAEGKRYLSAFTELQNQGRLRASPATDHFQQLTFFTQEAVRDVEFGGRFTAAMTDQTKGRYQKHVVFAVYPMDERGQEEEDEIDLFEIRHGLLELRIDHDSGVRLQHSELDTSIVHQVPQRKLDGRQEHEFRLLCVAGRAEVFLNGARLAYVPVNDKPRKLAFMIKAVGMTLAMRKVQLTELIERE